MSFMYKTMMTRSPNKRKIKINEQNLLSLMTNSDDEDEEDEDFTLSPDKEKEKKDDGSDEEANSTGSSDEEDDEKSESSNDEVSKEISHGDDQPCTSSRATSSSGKISKRKQKPLPCPTVKEVKSQITSEYYGMSSTAIDVLTLAKKQYSQSENAVNNMKSWPSSVCSVCLNEDSNSRSRKLITCQKCAISVHEDCYGVQHYGMKKFTAENTWICEACVYGGDDVVCQFCPNTWGCMKETKCGRWVHVVCARSILSDFFHHSSTSSRRSIYEKATVFIQLNDLNIKQFGSKECSLCEDRLVAKTGICIKCDAGLCKSTFHVTCAQRHGLLSKTQGTGDSNNNNNFGSGNETHIAYCQLHSEKEEIKKRQRNFILQLKTVDTQKATHDQRTQKRQNEVSSRLFELREIKKRQRNSYFPPRPPLEQVPRMLASDAHFTRLLNGKTEKMYNLNTRLPALVIPKATEIRKKHHVAPSLTTDFAAYFLDRELRLEEERSNLSSAINNNAVLSEKQEYERLKYNEMRSTFISRQEDGNKLKEEYNNLRQKLSWISEWASSEHITKSGAKRRKSLTPRKRSISNDTLSPISTPISKEQIPDAESIIDLKSCGICKGQENQHMLVKCDVCNEWQHLGCLDPPLTQMPKRTKFSLWQCSECADSSGSSSSETEMENRGSFTSQDGRRLTRRKRRVPEKLAIGFPDSPIRKTKGMIGHSKLINKQQTKLRETLKSLVKEQQKLKTVATVIERAQSDTDLKPINFSYSSEQNPLIFPKIEVGLPLGASCDNYLSLAARMPIINQPRQAPPTSTQKINSMKKIIVLKKSLSSPNRPMGLGQRRKYVILRKKAKLVHGLGLGQRKKVLILQKRPLGPIPAKAPDLPPQILPPTPEKVEPAITKTCDVCHAAEGNRNIVTCDKCKKNYHWECCDPPLKSNPVTRFNIWECSDCVDNEEESDDSSQPVEEKRGSSLTPEGRRVLNRKRKPPEVFEPAFRISNQKKIFKSLERKKKSQDTAASVEHSAARCRPIAAFMSSRKRFEALNPVPGLPFNVIQSSFSTTSLSKGIAIVRKTPGAKTSIINLVPNKNIGASSMVVSKQTDLAQSTSKEKN